MKIPTTILVLFLTTGIAMQAAETVGDPAPLEGLIFYQDFDHQGTALCGDGWACSQDVPEGRLVPGRFGRACRFERARTNFLSPNQASVESGTDGFQAGPGATITSAAAETAFGKRVLRAQGGGIGPLWSTAPATVRIDAPHRPAKVFLFSVHLRSDRPGVKVRLSLDDRNEATDWQAEVAAADRKAQAKNSKATAKAAVKTVTEPAVVVLASTWQRVAARLEVDARRAEQALVGRLELVEGPPCTVEADGLQLEQTCVYPLSNTDPTSWLLGGEASGPAWLDMPALHTGFSGRSGTLACWVRAMPEQCGGTRDVGAVLTVGTGWWTPAWQIGGPTWYAGDTPTRQAHGKLRSAAVQKRLLEQGTHEGWHHLTLAWDEHEAAGYLDGKPFAAAPLAAGESVPATILRLGGSFLERTPMTGDLDEVAIYSRRLSGDEIVALAETNSPLAGRLPTVLVRRPIRTEFLRSQSQAVIPLELVPYGTAPANVTLSASVPALNASLRQAWQLGRAVELPINPWLSEAGRCQLTVEVAAGKGTVRASQWLDIFEEPSCPEFITYAWGKDDPDLEERGFNCLFGEPTGLLRRGMWAIARIDVRDAVPHPWSPESRRRAQPIARQTALAAMAHANVRACLVNSELSHPPFPAGQKWFLDWLKAETGLEEIPSSVTPRPLRIAAQSDADVPALLADDYPPYKFLRWWTARGQGYYLLNNQLARWMREAGLKTACYSDQPEVAGQFEALDLVDFWGYPKSPDGLVARFSHASCLARLEGKPFQAMPGTVYWDDGNGLWVNDTDGTRKVLCLSPDCLKENLWISVACPSTNIGLYGLGERHTQLYDKACDQAMTEAYRLIRPVGVLAGGLPAEQAKVALLETDGLCFLQPGVKDQYARHWLMRIAGRVLARARVPFDWITDDHVRAGWLKHYQAVVVPGAWALPDVIHRALVDYARSGGQVVADRVMRADIPGMRRLDIDTQVYPDEAVDRELGGWARSIRPTLATWATVSPAESVFTYTREAGDARYVMVINDRRQSGPQFERWKVMLNAIGRTKLLEPLRDQGLPQEVQVSLPTGLAAYDVLKHKRVDGESAGGQQRLTVSLEAGGAAVLAAFPRALKEVVLKAPPRMKKGSEADIALEVRDDAGQPVPGRQLAEIRVLRPDGQAWGGVQRYGRIVDGRLELPLRLPLSAKTGPWRLEVVEWISGLQAAATVVVE